MMNISLDDVLITCLTVGGAVFLLILYNFISFLFLGLIKEFIFLFIKKKKNSSLYYIFDDIIMAMAGLLPVIIFIVLLVSSIFSHSFIFIPIILIFIFLQLYLIRTPIKKITNMIRGRNNL